jgi:5-methylcytosine-specific restriction endonuclease McrA
MRNISPEPRLLTGNRRRLPMSVRRPGQFFKTAGWHQLRRKRLAYAHYQCECCGAREQLQLDHIRSRATDGDHRRLTLHEVQVLCRRCNQAKGTLELTATELRDLLHIDPRQAMGGTIFTRRIPRIG